MKNELNTLRKFLAPLVIAPTVVGLATVLPDPWGKVFAAVLTLIGAFVNWGHLPPPGGSDGGSPAPVPATGASVPA